MKPRRKKGSRLLAGVPTIVVCGLWVVLCQAWPSREQPAVAQRRHLQACVRYLEQEPADSGALLFVRSPQDPGDLLTEESPDALRVMRIRGRAHLLDRAEPAAAGGDIRDRLAVPWPAGSNVAFRVSLPDEPVFAAVTNLERRIATEVSDSLRRRGFRLPEFDPSLWGRTGVAWQVALAVECGEDGKLADVYVEAGTADPALNLAVARSVETSGAADAGAPCRGRVIISYGEE